MSDIRKAAILLLALPEKEAGLLVSKLEPEQIEAVSIEIARLGNIPWSETKKAAVDFSKSDLANASTGTLESATALVTKAMGKKAAPVLDRIARAVQKLPFGFLRGIPLEDLKTFTQDEHPQTIALILSHLPPNQVAELVADLPTIQQAQVIHRMANIGSTSATVVEKVELGLQGRMVQPLNQSTTGPSGKDSVAAVLNLVDRMTEVAILDKLSEKDPILVEEIRGLMFVFEDIAKLSNNDIQTLLKNVEMSQWATALKGCGDELRQRILDNLSERAQAVLLEEMEFTGPVRVTDAERTRRQITDIVRMLQDQQQISVSPGTEQEEFIS